MLTQPCSPRTSRPEIRYRRGKDRPGLLELFKDLPELAWNLPELATAYSYHFLNTYESDTFICLISTLRHRYYYFHFKRWEEPGSQKSGKLPNVMACRIVAWTELTLKCSFHFAMLYFPWYVYLPQKSRKHSEEGKKREHPRKGHLIPTPWVTNTYHGTLQRLGQLSKNCHWGKRIGIQEGT